MLPTMNSSVLDEWNITNMKNNSNANVTNSSDFSSPPPTIDSNWSTWNVNTTNNTTIIIVQGPTNWEGYLFGLFCLTAACGFVLAPTWYLDRRRHSEFVGDRGGERRSRRRLRRSRRRRRRILGVATTTSEGERPPPEEPADREAYIMSMLVTETAQRQEPSKREDTDGEKKVPEIFVLDDNNDCCPICLHDYTAGEEICYSKNGMCQHEFHRSCLVPWLMKHYHCPLCRLNYLAEKEKPAGEKPAGDDLAESCDDHDDNAGRSDGGSDPDDHGSIHYNRSFDDAQEETNASHREEMSAEGSLSETDNAMTGEEPNDGDSSVSV